VQALVVHCWLVQVTSCCMQVVCGSRAGDASGGSLQLDTELNLEVVDFVVAVTLLHEAALEAERLDLQHVRELAPQLLAGCVRRLSAAAASEDGHGVRSSLEERLLKGGRLLSWLRGLHVFQTEETCYVLLTLARSLINRQVGTLPNVLLEMMVVTDVDVAFEVGSAIRRPPGLQGCHICTAINALAHWQIRPPQCTGMKHYSST
jgi:hypothetical protein